MTNSTTDKELRYLRFMAIDPFVETNIVRPVEESVRGANYIKWGERNDYPDYLLSLYDECTTLRSVVNGLVDFIAGDDVVCNVPAFSQGMNRTRMTPQALIRELAFSLAVWGAPAIEVIRNRMGAVAEIYPVQTRFLRTDKDNQEFWYSEKWGVRGLRKDEAIAYPRFIEGGTHDKAILWAKGISTKAYPAPLYAAAVKACEMERSIDDYHLNAIANNFSGGILVNFNGGKPKSSEIMEEVEDDFSDKFTGKENAGRVMFSWNDSIQTRTTLETVKTEDFGEKYQTLAKWSRQQIFAAFRANPNLFGIATESSGFNSEEYESAFKLFNRCVVEPAQRMICDMIDKVTGFAGSMTIRPFSLEGNAEDNVN